MPGRTSSSAESGRDAAAPEDHERVEWVTGLDRFRALAEPWDQLAGCDETPFLLHAWMLAWWDAFGAGRCLRVCALWWDEELVGVFPLCAARGCWKAMANSESPVFRPIARDQAALRRLVDVVIEHAPGRLILPALPATDPALEALEDACASRGRWTLVEDQYTSPIADIGGDLAGYLLRIKPQPRAAAERRRRRLVREHQPTFLCLEPPNDLEAQLQRYLEIEAAGWKGRNGTALLCVPEMERFYRSVARSFAATGSLRLSELALEGRLVAFELQIVHRRRVFAWKRGFDEAYRGLGPGMVLQLDVLARCGELGFDAYEFLGPDEPYKRRFATSQREHRRMRSYRRRPLSGTEYVYRAVARPALKLAYGRAVDRFPAVARLRQRGQTPEQQP